MKKEIEPISPKRGYLRGDFEYFHLKDKQSQEFEFHHHDFNKMIIFLSGEVTYMVEGKAYKLRPWDILLVNSREVHKPLITPDTLYERMIIWVNEDYIQKHNSSDCDLLTCFEQCSERKQHLLRLDPEQIKPLRLLLLQLETACKSSEFGCRILRNALFIQFMVYLNRSFLGAGTMEPSGDVEYDENIVALLNHINRNLGEELSVDALASKFYMSKYYLMHKFKQQTGYSLHSYILQKRLILANNLMKKGMSATEAAVSCGYSDYSSFVRAFKKMFGLSPRNYSRRLPGTGATQPGERHFT